MSSRHGDRTKDPRRQPWTLLSASIGLLDHLVSPCHSSNDVFPRLRRTFDVPFACFGQSTDRSVDDKEKRKAKKEV